MSNNNLVLEIDDIANHLKAIAEICEQSNIEHLDLSVHAGVYKFASVESNIYFQEETEKHKEAVQNLEEYLKIKSDFEKEGKHD